MYLPTYWKMDENGTCSPPKISVFKYQKKPQQTTHSQFFIGSLVRPRCSFKRSLHSGRRSELLLFSWHINQIFKNLWLVVCNSKGQINPFKMTFQMYISIEIYTCYVFIYVHLPWCSYFKLFWWVVSSTFSFFPRQWSNGQVLYSQCRRPPKGRDGRNISIWIGCVHQVPFEKRFDAKKNCMAGFHAEIHDHDIMLFFFKKPSRLMLTISANSRMFFIGPKCSKNSNLRGSPKKQQIWLPSQIPG